MSEDSPLGQRAAAARRRAEKLHEESAQIRSDSDEIMRTASRARQAANALPHCPICRHDETQAALRTPFVQYYRCPRCGYVWSRSHQESDSAPKSA